VGFSVSPPLAALGGAFCSSAISVDACGKAPFYGQQKDEFLHIANKHVNRSEMAGGSGIIERRIVFREIRVGSFNLKGQFFGCGPG
jgi:hypothetical protein